MKHKEFRNRVAYARRFGKLEVENVVMKERIHRLVRDNNRVVKSSVIWKKSIRMCYWNLTR